MSAQADERVPAWPFALSLVLAIVGTVPFTAQAGGGVLLFAGVLTLALAVASVVVFSTLLAYRRVAGVERRTGRTPVRLTGWGMTGFSSPRPRR